MTGAAKDSLVCWKCGSSLATLPLPLSRLAQCSGCKVELHTCRLCEHYEAHTTRQCREIRAEEVITKDRANYCDWFKPRTNAFDTKRQVKADVAKSKIDALFGGATAEDVVDPARSEVEKLFQQKNNDK